MIQLSVVLVSHPGIMHNTLLSMLESLPCTTVLGASGALSALDLLNQNRADTVVIDANLPLDEKVTLLKQIKRDFAHMRCIVLTTTTRNHHILRDVGADVLLSQNSSWREFETAVCVTDGLATPEPEDGQTRITEGRAKKPNSQGDRT